jgi:hypothetical protein
MLSRRATVAGVPLGDLSFAKIISARSDARLAKRNQLGFCKLLAWMKEDSRHEQSERSFDKRINLPSACRAPSQRRQAAPPQLGLSCAARRVPSRATPEYRV